MAGAGKRALLAVLAVAVYCAAVPASGAANAGELDPGFGVGGMATLEAHNPYPRDLAIDHSGRIVVGGFWASPGGVFPLLARLGPDGSPSQNFAFDSALDYWCDYSGSIAGVAIDEAGRMVLAGTTVHLFAAPSGICVVRLLSNGELDPGFSGDGKFTLGTAGAATDVATDPEDRILIAGDDGLTAVRLTSGGELDPTFGEGGIASLHLGEESEAQAIATDPSGRIVLAGTATTSGRSEMALARLDAGGHPDPGFAGTGHETLDFPGAAGDEVATDIDSDAFGRLVLSGRQGTEGSEAALAARLLPDGGLDTSFGGGGRLLLPLGGVSVANELAVDRSNRILVAGGLGVLKQGARLWDPFLLRLGPEGAFDGSFGTAGLVREGFTDFGGGSTAVEIDSAGRYLTTAKKSPDAFVVARYLPEDQVTPAPRYSCRGSAATIAGTRGDDALRGTRHRDVIVAFGGNDRIRAFGGRDLVCAGSGRDLVRGGKGNDSLYGGRGDDRLFGQAGRDRLRGGPGSDRLVGGPGLDSLRR